MRSSAWRLLADPAADGAWNMAVDEAIADAVGEGRVPPTLRLYRWDRPHVSLGYLQTAPGGVDLAACRWLEIPIIRRPSGGRAVLHAQELTYSVAVPLDGSWRDLPVAHAFRVLCQGLIAGLRHLGLLAELGKAASGAGNDRTKACFLLRGLPAVLVKGRKLIGSAQRRYDRSLLQHGSLLLDFDPTLHKAVFPGWPRKDPASGITCLRALLGGPPPIQELCAALAAGWSEAFQAPCVPGVLGPNERAHAGELRGSRYTQDAWTFRR